MHSHHCDMCPRCDTPLDDATEETPFAWCEACDVGWLGLGFDRSVAPARVLAS